MTDRETQEAHETLTEVVSALSELLGRPSRWTGTLELTDSLFSSGVAHLDGRIEITPRSGVSRSIAGGQLFTRRCTSAHHPVRATNTVSIVAGRRVWSSRCRG